MRALEDGNGFDASVARPIFQTEIDELGGAERSAIALADWLYERELPAYILTYGDRCGIAKYAKHPVPVVELKREGSRAEKIAALRRHLESRSTDAPALLCSGYPASLHATRAGARGFHSLMHDTPSLFSDAHHRSLKSHLRLTVTNRTLRRGLGSGGVTIVTSDYLKADCKKYFGVEAQIQRMGGMTVDGRKDDAADGPHTWMPGEELKLLSVCRVEANKRIDWLLEGMAALTVRAVAPLGAPIGTMVEWRMDLAGAGSQIGALNAKARELGIGERVHFHGFVSDEDLDGLYRQAHLFLMPALQGYGIPAVEALSRGLPVLLHRESGVSDILLDTPWATVLRGGRENTATALAKAIDGVLTRRQLMAARPVIPTEAVWAEGVSKLCGWLV